MTIFKPLLSMTFFLLCFSTSHAQITEKADNDFKNIGTANDSIPSHFEEIILTQDPLFIKAKLNGKWGTIGLDGEMIIPFEYEKVWLGMKDDPYHNQLVYVTKSDGKKRRQGLITLKGEVILPTRFESVQSTSWPIVLYEPKLPDLFGVALNKKWGYANKKGEIVIPCKYDYGSRFCKDRAVVFIIEGEEKSSYLINEKGEILTKEPYAQIVFYDLEMNKGLVKSHNGKQGMINLDGEVKVPVIYDKMTTGNSYGKRNGSSSKSPRHRYRVQDDFIRVFKTYEGYGLLNEEGEVLWPCNRQSDTWTYYFGLYRKDELTSFQNKLLLNSEFSRATVCYQNYYIVYKEKKVGVMDILSEEMILPCIYESVNAGFPRCSLDYFVVEKNKKYGLVNASNEIIIPIDYERIRMNKLHGIAVVTKDKKKAIFDLRGNPVTGFDFDVLRGDFFEPYLAKKGTKYGYIDRTGKEILPFIYEGRGGFFPRDKFGKRIENATRSCEGVIKGELLTDIKNSKGETLLMNIQGDTLSSMPSPSDFVKLHFERGPDRKYRIYAYKDGEEKVYGKDIDRELLAEEMAKNHGFMSFHYTNLYFLKNHKVLRVEEMQDLDELKGPICWVKTDGQYYFINNLGEKVNTLSFDKIGQESEGLRAVAKDGKIGFINEQVELVIPYDFDDAYNQVPAFEFKNGVSIAFKNKKHGFIDKTGKVLVPFHFEAICYFDGEMGFGYRKGKWEKVEF